MSRGSMIKELKEDIVALQDKVEEYRDEMQEDADDMSDENPKLEELSEDINALGSLLGYLEDAFVVVDEM